MIELGRRHALGVAVAIAMLNPTGSKAKPVLWREGVCLNQWNSDRCTAWAAAAGVLGGLPRMTFEEGQEFAQLVWRQAETLDIYPGRVTGGATTMQGSAAALVELGLCTSVRWIEGVDQVIAALHRGPVIWASPWMYGMVTPRRDRMQLGSEIMRLSHAAAITGYDPARGLRVRNSWGRSWAGDGSAWISVADFRRLWAWQPGPEFPGPTLPTYGEVYQPVGLAYPPIRDAAHPSD